MEVMFLLLHWQEAVIHDLTRDLGCPWHGNCIICSYDVTGANFKNSLYAFGQSEKSWRVQCIITSDVFPYVRHFRLILRTWQVFLINYDSSYREIQLAPRNNARDNQFLSFAMFISRAMFEEHSSNISRDILDWIFYCFGRTTYDVITFLFCIMLACKQSLRMGYSEICFRMARGQKLGCGREMESLQWSLYSLSIYVQILNVNFLARPCAVRKQISE